MLFEAFFVIMNKLLRADLCEINTEILCKKCAAHNSHMAKRKKRPETYARLLKLIGNA